jgi:hypothetical protein
MITLPRLKAGDIVCTRDDSWLSKAIRWAERTPGEEASQASHVGVMYTSAKICEALWKTEIRPLKPTLDDRYVDIFRPNLFPSEVSDIKKKLRKWEGDQYGWWKIGLHGGDKLVANAIYATTGIQYSPRVFRWFGAMDKYPICSWVVGYAFETVLPNYFGIEPWAAQPDDIHDYCLLKVEAGLMEHVYRSEGW